MLRDNKVWMGCTIHSGDREFGVQMNILWKQQDAELTKMERNTFEKGCLWLPSIVLNK